ncbi:Uncharacterised protein [Mycobacteroides abscessus subsp. massiliense]|nr:Uncharacterised protein [Mycobacteroides abscessus subsp. massiliense]
MGLLTTREEFDEPPHIAYRHAGTAQPQHQLDTFDVVVTETAPATGVSGDPRKQALTLEPAQRIDRQSGSLGDVRDGEAGMGWLTCAHKATVEPGVDSRSSARFRARRHQSCRRYRARRHLHR